MTIPKDLSKSISEIPGILANTRKSPAKTLDAILKKAQAKKGLSLKEVGFLVNLNKQKLVNKLFRTAARIKQEIYGERLVFFAPLYVSDYCMNDCEYCSFHQSNINLHRRKLTLSEVKEQTKFLINQGHKRILLEFGEDVTNNNIKYITDVIKAIYSVKIPVGNPPGQTYPNDSVRRASVRTGIRRVNVNIAATTSENYRRLKQAHIGTYQLFQETYHRPTYERLHKGPKADYERQITAHLRAFKGGLDDVGLGVLFGLYDWRYEVLALVAHAQYLDKTYGVGPHTISVPRFCPAPGVSYKPEYPVSDADFLKLIAILRLAVPYTGMIISTRESARIREKAFQIGISQSSAGSVTTIGGYPVGQSTSRPVNRQTGRPTDRQTPQFTIRDERSLRDVIDDVLKHDLVPSFCTACYRIGRTGKRFMRLAKPGEIHNFCRPNALLTFAEYLTDFAKDGLRTKGKRVITTYLNQIEDKRIRKETQRRLDLIAKGKRDIYF